MTLPFVKEKDWIFDMIRYSINEGNPEIKQWLQKIEQLHARIRKLWWNALHIEETEERRTTREFLLNSCQELERIQETLLKYRGYYLGKLEERLQTFSQIDEDYYERFKDRGLMI